MKRLCLMVLMMASLRMFAAPVYDTENGKYSYRFPYYVVTVGEGATAILNSNASIVKYNDAADEGTTVTYAEFFEATDGNLIKAGAGTLKITAALSNWVGQIHVMAGRLESLCVGSLGKQVCGIKSRSAIGDATLVHNGATLYRKSESSGLTIAGDLKMIVIEGSGEDGRGVLVTDAPTSNETNWPLGFDLVLTGDAVIRSASAGWNMKTSWSPEPGQRIELNGHTLTIMSEVKNQGSGFLQNHTPTTAGNIVVSNMAYKLYGSGEKLALEGGPDCKLTLTDQSILQFNGGFYGRNLSWTLVADDIKYLQPTTAGLYAPDAYHAWCGPVFLKNDIPLYCNYNGQSMVSIVGYTYGPGGFPKAANLRNLDFHLFCPTNSFEGEVVMDSGCALHLHNSGALPANGAGAIITNGIVVLYGKDYNLPSMKFDGETAVTNAAAQSAGNVRTALVKTGSGTLDASEVELSSPWLDVRGGTYKFKPKSHYEQLAGFYEGVIVDETGTGANPIRTSRQLPDNPELVFGINKMTTGWQKCSCLVYYGYIWNREATNVTWNFYTRAGNGATLFIDTTKVMDGFCANVDYGYWCTVNATPGPHYFEARYYSAMGSQGIAAETAVKKVRVNNSSGEETPIVGERWDGTKGLAWDPLGRGVADPANFRAFADDGSGYYFTYTADPELVAEAQQIYPIYEKMSFASGTTLDMDGLDYPINTLEGCPTIIGELRVLNKWTIDAAQVASGAKLTTEGKLEVVGVIEIVASSKAGNSPAEGWVVAEANGGIELADGWQETVTYPDDGGVYTLKLSADKKKLFLRHEKGSILIIK